jgi:hypothetical protein
MLDDRSSGGGYHHPAVVVTDTEGIVPAIGFASRSFCILPPAMRIDGMVAGMPGAYVMFEVSKPFGLAKVYWDRELVATVKKNWGDGIPQGHEAFVLIYQSLGRRTEWGTTVFVPMKEEIHVWQR